MRWVGISTEHRAVVILIMPPTLVYFEYMCNKMRPDLQFSAIRYSDFSPFVPKYLHEWVLKRIVSFTGKELGSQAHNDKSGHI